MYKHKKLMSVVALVTIMFFGNYETAHAITVNPGWLVSQVVKPAVYTTGLTYAGMLADGILATSLAWAPAALTAAAVAGTAVSVGVGGYLLYRTLKGPGKQTSASNGGGITVPSEVIWVDPSDFAEHSASGKGTVSLSAIQAEALAYSTRFPNIAGATITQSQVGAYQGQWYIPGALQAQFTEIGTATPISAQPIHSVYSGLPANNLVFWSRSDLGGGQVLHNYFTAILVSPPDPAPIDPNAALAAITNPDNSLKDNFSGEIDDMITAYPNIVHFDDPGITPITPAEALNQGVTTVQGIAAQSQAAAAAAATSAASAGASATTASGAVAGANAAYAAAAAASVAAQTAVGAAQAALAGAQTAAQFAAAQSAITTALSNFAATQAATAAAARASDAALIAAATGSGAALSKALADLGAAQRAIAAVQSGLATQSAAAVEQAHNDSTAIKDKLQSANDALGQINTDKYGTPGNPSGATGEKDEGVTGWLHRIRDIGSNLLASMADLKASVTGARQDVKDKRAADDAEIGAMGLPENPVLGNYSGGKINPSSLPVKKDIPGALTSFLSNSPVVSMIKGIVISTNNDSADMSFQYQGKTVNASFSHWDSLIGGVGTSMLVIVHGLGMFIIFRRE